MRGEIFLNNAFRLLLLFLVVSPNIQIAYQNIIIHDWISILVFIFLILRVGLSNEIFVSSIFFIIYTLFCLLFIQDGNAWLVILRFTIYTSIIFLSRNYSAKFSSECSYWNLKKVAFTLIFSYFLLDILQRMQIIQNIFQVDYYMRALGTLIENDGHRYAWFDEHFVGTPALIVLSIVAIRRFSFPSIIFFSVYNGSRMFAVGLYCSFISIIKSTAVRNLVILFTIVSFAYFTQTDYFKNFSDVQLRINNWNEHLNVVDGYTDFFLGYNKEFKGLDKVPIDNFLIRYFVNLGVMGLAFVGYTLYKIYIDSNKTERLFMITYIFSALLNDIFAYPPALATFCGGLALFRILKIK